MVNNYYYLHCPFWPCFFSFTELCKLKCSISKILVKRWVTIQTFIDVTFIIWGIMLITWNFVAMCLNQVVVLQIHWSKNLFSTNEAPESVPTSHVAWHISTDKIIPHDKTCNIITVWNSFEKVINFINKFPRKTNNICSTTFHTNLNLTCKN